ncbi:MAG: hypothetical protein B6244_14290 [Candidatus Cloacimonetes bacterium 4572_55]|nr:MAG: hypothetical protein B6244_14290 [Candidatus Cloacimonetes bacterium 4572_55]
MSNSYLRTKIDRFIHHKYTDIFIIVLILLSVTLVFIDIGLSDDDPFKTVLFFSDWGIIAIFVVELSVRFYIAPRKRKFFRRYWVDIIAIMPLFRAFRMLRVLRLLRIFRLGLLLNRRLSRFTQFFSEAYGEYLTIGIVVMVVILAGSVSLHLVENEVGSPENPHFKPLTKAFFWTLYTLIAGEMGQGEPSTVTGKVIAIIVMLSGLTLFAIFTGIISAAMVQKLKLQLEDKFMELEDLEDHTLICGWNRKGTLIVEELQSDKTERDRYIVIIAELECAPKFDSKIVDWEIIYFMSADYTSLDVLKKAKADKATKAIILADKTRDRSDQDRDARTVLTALTIEKMNPTIFTCAELLNGDNEVHLEMAGVEEVIISDGYAATLMATATTTQGIIHLTKEIFSAKYGNQLIKIPSSERISQMTFSELSVYLKREHDAILISIERRDKFHRNKTFVNPSSDFQILPDDSLVLISREKLINVD